MSQKMINDLTDRVSVLQADVSRLTRERDDWRGWARSYQEGGKEIARTADSLLGENKRLKAENDMLTNRLVAYMAASGDTDQYGATQRVEELKIEARNAID